MKKYYLLLLVGVLSLSHVGAARLYNLESINVSNDLDSLNRDVGLNVDVVVLREGDVCAEEMNFGMCVREEYSDASDFIFILNLAERRMESLVRENLREYVLPSQQLLEIEQKVTSFLQQENYEGGIRLYLDELEKYIRSSCQKEQLPNCRVDLLDTALRESERQQNENSAKSIATATRWAGGGVVSILLVLRLASLIRQQRRRIKNRNYLRELKKNTSFLSLQIRHDKNIFDHDQKDLLKELEMLSTRVENLQSQDSLLITQQVKEHTIGKQLYLIQKKYEDMLMTIASTDELDAAKDRIRKTNI